MITGDSLQGKQKMADTVKIKSWCSKLTKVENEPNCNKKEKIELSAFGVKSESQSSYKSYSQRWWLLASVALLNIANYAHWISFASVNSKAAVFYQVKTVFKSLIW